MVATLLDNDKPIIARWAWLDVEINNPAAIHDLGKGHFIVITGYTGTDPAHNLVYYIDPSTGVLYKGQNYSWIQEDTVGLIQHENIGTSTNPIWCKICHSWDYTLEVNVSTNPPPDTAVVPFPIVLGNNGTNGQAAAIKTLTSVNFLIQQLILRQR